MFYATRQILNHSFAEERLKVSRGLKGKKFIVQGFGNVGYWASKFFVGEGATLIGVSIVNPVPITGM